MRDVTVVGGGFSGLVTAYYLARSGVHVTLLEKEERLGGLLGTKKTEFGLVELAANGMRPSARVEALCEALGVPLVESRSESRKRFLYRGKPRQWPLRVGETAGFAARLATSVATRGFRPGEGETIDRWSSRVVGPAAAHYIVGAALQGIYAGDPKRLSASLIFGKGRRRPERGKLKTLVAPRGGMAQLINALADRLRELGAEIHTGVAAAEDVTGRVVICTSVRDAAGLIAKRAPHAAELLQNVEMLPLVRVTAFYASEENTIGGFGVLFPRGEGIDALGVLFNTNIFDERGPAHSESWIFGGAEDRGAVQLSDEQLFERLARDRARVFGREANPLAVFTQRWPAALPHYDLRLETIVRNGLELPPDVHLGGNYLSGIGLPMLVERAWAVAEELTK